MTKDTQNTTHAPDRLTEELLRLPRTPQEHVEGLTVEETQRLADALGYGVSTTLPNGRFLYLQPQEVDDPDRLDYGPAA